MAHHNDFGKRGEEIACRYLQEKEYTILATNFRFGRGEIDVIAKQNETIIFAEVKTRSSDKFGYPEESVTESKKEKLKQTATEFLLQNNLSNEIRFDVIAITIQKDKTDIYHIEDAFFH
ncbi:MAG TPA: YraN family protein [Chitinophagales bacterium]